jgi:EAL domain-containing protein (putative c-di-GMP-specific phosphodiesterase class I)
LPEGSRRARRGSNSDVTTVAEVLKRSAFLVNRLCLELTERESLVAAYSVRADLNRLRELGVRLTIDDFGTG